MEPIELQRVGASFQETLLVILRQVQAAHGVARRELGTATLDIHPARQQDYTLAAIHRCLA